MKREHGMNRLVYKLLASLFLSIIFMVGCQPGGGGGGGGGNGGPKSPVVTSFSINSGAVKATARDVVLNSTCTGSPTHYMASESPTFFGAAWAIYNAAQGFQLSVDDGIKTVYFKVKNAAGQESMAVNDSINLHKVTEEDRQQAANDIEDAMDNLVQGSEDLQDMADKLNEAQDLDPDNKNVLLVKDIVDMLLLIKQIAVDPALGGSSIVAQDLAACNDFYDLYTHGGFVPATLNPDGTTVPWDHTFWHFYLVYDTQGQGDVINTAPSSTELRTFVENCVIPEAQDFLTKLKEIPADYSYAIDHVDSGGQFFDNDPLDDTAVYWIDYGDVSMLKSMLALELAELYVLGAYNWDGVNPNDFDNGPVLIQDTGPGDTYGNDCAHAFTVNLNSAIATNLTSGDMDFFKITVSNPGQLWIYTTGDLDTYGYLRDSSCAVMKEDDDSGVDGNFTIYRKLNPGTYYVEVKGYDTNETGNYTLYIRMDTLDALSVIETKYPDLGKLIHAEYLPTAKQYYKDAFGYYQTGALYIRNETAEQSANGLLTLDRTTFDTVEDKNDFLADEASFRTWATNVLGCLDTNSYCTITQEPDGDPLPGTDHINIYRFFQGVNFKNIYWKTIVNPMTNKKVFGLTSLSQITNQMITADGIIGLINGATPTAGDLQLGYLARFDNPASGEKVIDGSLADWSSNKTLINQTPHTLLDSLTVDLGDIYVALGTANLYVAYFDHLAGASITDLTRYELDIESDGGWTEILCWLDEDTFIWTCESSGEWLCNPGCHEAAPVYSPSGNEVAVPLENFTGDPWVRIIIREDYPGDSIERQEVFVNIQ